MGDTMRDGFETWLIDLQRSRGIGWKLTDAEFVKRNDDGRYSAWEFNLAWDAWQAAREAGRQLGMEQANALWQMAKDAEEKGLHECTWKPDDDGTYWTTCGQGFVFNCEGGPREHDMRFCCYCGNGITQQAGDSDTKEN